MSSMSSHLYPMLQADDWRGMVALVRQWFRSNAPRYDSETTECKCNIVGTWFGYRQQYEERTRLPERDAFGPNPRILRPEQIEPMLRDNIDRFFDGEVGTYRRHCQRIDNPTAAEERVEEHLRRLAYWRELADRQTAGVPA